MSSLRLAAAQFPVFEPSDWSVVETRLADWIAQAAQAGARLLLFPEYAAMSLAALFAPRVRADLAQQLRALQDLRERYLDLHVRLAREHGVYLLAGSFPWTLEDGRSVNRAWLCAPDGCADFQDKQIMTRFEREQWHISPAPGLKVFDTALGRIAVNICYDSEFPLLARAQAEAGAELILVPSCTDTLAGYHRVRVGCQARALENQCLVVQSPLVGEAPWSPAVDVNVGAAGVFGPPDRGFPDDGVLALGPMNQAQWLFADVDLAAVARVRAEGQVFNHRHWPEQAGSPGVKLCRL
ncbi:MAG TPA: carbon-nitrogen hydrolase family protein [Solimonas sp.]|nr:carbon-nitrogen hydrolase family protein [Solimonas sp.]